jgi:hypothetical protein
MKMQLKKGDKVRVIDDMIFPDEIPRGTSGWVLSVDKEKEGKTLIKFYPSGGEKVTFELENTTDLTLYLKHVRN